MDLLAAGLWDTECLCVTTSGQQGVLCNAALLGNGAFPPEAGLPDQRCSPSRFTRTRRAIRHVPPPPPTSSTTPYNAAYGAVPSWPPTYRHMARAPKSTTCRLRVSALPKLRGTCLPTPPRPNPPAPPAAPPASPHPALRRPPQRHTPCTWESPAAPPATQSRRTM